ncbi:MAG: STAS domain-containing protein [Acidimicrobiales bacterium]|nr:STAS domain-containing protein [Acidimicrobiales bacterium]MBO0892952.1 STAS domain-containing protein [Acidimicrobiales bacterium]
MAVPILRQSSYLIATLESAMADREIKRLQDELADQVGRFRAKGVVIDVTAMDVIDSFSARALRTIASMTRLRGAPTVVVGIQPEVAHTMVQLGLTFQDVNTALDLEEGLALLRRRTGNGS